MVLHLSRPIPIRPSNLMRIDPVVLTGGATRSHSKNIKGPVDLKVRPSSTKPFWFSPGSGLLGPVVLKEPSVSMLGKCKGSSGSKLY